MQQLPSNAMPSLFAPRPVRVWVVIGVFVVYLIFSFSLFFQAIAPVANFHFRPIIPADSGAYWEASGVRTTNFAEQEYEGASASGNLFGPVIEAELLRTDLNVAIFNCLLFGFCLWLLHGMREFDRTTFLLLMMMNPFLLASLISLNKEIFALAGIVIFVRYTGAKRFRIPLLGLAVVISLMARWQQVLVILIYVAFESKLSPLRGRRRWGVAVALLAFTIGYGLIYRLVPLYLAALLAQAQAGHLILILDNIQAHFGFPLVVIPKILMNCMGRLISPGYFLHDYLDEDFSNWRDAIFNPLHTVVLTVLLLGMFFSRKLRLRHAPVYALVLYLMMTALNPMVQPRYEYSAYVLLCLEASRYFRLGGGETARGEQLVAEAAPSLA